MKKIIITGASGFFGKSLIDSLENLREDFECYCVYNLSNTIRITDRRFKWVQCNLLDKKKVERLISDIKPTHLVHLAWYVLPQKFWTAKENVDWFYESVNLFQLFCSNGGKVFIGAGTLAEYDWDNMPLDEAVTPLFPNTLYGQCKKYLYDILIGLRNVYYPQTNIIWPRIGYFFGPNEPKEKLISKLIHNIQNNLPIDLACAEFERPYAHVKYFGQAITQLLKNELTNDVIFNMSSSVNYNLKEIVDFIQKNLKKTSNKVCFDTYQTKPSSITVVNKRLESNVGFVIPDTFFSDLRATVEEKVGHF